MSYRRVLVLFALCQLFTLGVFPQAKKPKAVRPSGEQKATPITKPQPNSKPEPSDAGKPIKPPTEAFKGILPDALVYSERPFATESLDWTKVPVNFYGNDFKKILLAFALRRLAGLTTKDEFETTAAFEKRIREAETKPLFGSLTPRSRMAFIANEIDSKYDADTQILSVQIELSPLPYFEGKLQTASFTGVKVLKPSVEDLGIYKGQNAFGVTREVTKAKLNKYLFAFANDREFKAIENFLSGRFELPLPLEQAREAKANLRILFIVSLSKPFMGSYIDSRHPKIDSPYDVETFTTFLTGRLEEIWFFNRKTGEVYKKVSAIPITNGTLKVVSNVADLLLLDKSMTDILVQSGAIAVEKTTDGGAYDLIATLIKASRKSKKKYQAFLDIVLPEIRKHTVYSGSTGVSGTTQIENLKFGKYYVFGSGTTDYGTYFWDSPVTINKDEQSFSLSPDNVKHAISK